jgi:hypothetical protein
MTLLELQRRMVEDVRRPLTLDFQMQSFTSDGSPVDDIASSYIAPNRRLSSFERLEIYNRQYWFRLSSALGEDYPTVQAVLGTKRFEALTVAYLREHPSVSWTLRDLGAKLPAFLVAHPELCGRRHRLVTEVADLEWAYVEAFDGKHCDPITPEMAQSIGPESQLALQPHLQLLELHYPVDDLVLAVKRAMPAVDIVSAAVTRHSDVRKVDLPAMRRTRLYLAVHRHENTVYYRRLEPGAYRLFTALRSGAVVAEAVRDMYAGSRLSAAAQAEELQACFAHASQLGWFCPWN